MYKRQVRASLRLHEGRLLRAAGPLDAGWASHRAQHQQSDCLLYTSDAADERSSVDLGGRRIIKKKKIHSTDETRTSSKLYPHGAIYLNKT